MPNRSTVLVIAATALVALLGIGAWMNWRNQPTDPLYLALKQIAVAAALGDTAPGAAGVDVSDKACPLVDAEKLNQMEFNLGNPLPQNVRYWVVQFNSWLPCLDRNGNRALLIGIDPNTHQCHASAVVQRACEFSL